MATSRKRRQQKFLRDYGEMPVLWVEGSADEVKPIIDTYTSSVDHAINQAFHAASLGMNFRLDFYTAPIDDDTTQDEAHLVVFRQIKSDAYIGVRPDTERAGLYDSADAGNDDERGA